MRKKRELLNIFADNLDQYEFLKEIETKMDGEESFYILFSNVDVIIKAENNQYLRKIINEADFSLIDGMPLIWISKLYGEPFKQKLSGSDMVPKICRLSEQKGWKIFLLGGKTGVAQKAAYNLQIKYPKLKIVGTYSPPIGFDKNKDEIIHINQMIYKSGADIVVVCFGCPKQEIFVYKNYKKYGAKMSICAGATIDFIAGQIRRCPKWISRIGFEWFFRFLMEPRRMFKRYFVDDMKIFGMIWKYRSQMNHNR